MDIGYPLLFRPASPNFYKGYLDVPVRLELLDDLPDVVDDPVRGGPVELQSVQQGGVHHSQVEGQKVNEHLLVELFQNQCNIKKN